MTNQTSVGTIDDHDIHITINGPEQQNIADDSDRVGSDVLMVRVERALADVKREVENE